MQDERPKPLRKWRTRENQSQDPTGHVPLSFSLGNLIPFLTPVWGYIGQLFIPIMQSWDNYKEKQIVHLALGFGGSSQWSRGHHCFGPLVRWHIMMGICQRSFLLLAHSICPQCDGPFCPLDWTGNCCKAHFWSTGFVSYWCDKTPEQSNLRKEGVTWAYGLRVVREAWWQECEVTGHAVSTVKRKG